MALDWFNRRMRDGVPIEQALADDRSKHPENLAIVNVEAVNTRWVTDLGGFLEAVDNQVFDAFGDTIATSMKEDEVEKDETKGRLKPKKVEGAGWVIEIRGYTDHHKGTQFIKDSLIKNLQNMDRFEAAKDDKKIGKYIVGVADPVKGKVSHAFIYKVWLETTPSPTPS